MGLDASYLMKVTENSETLAVCWLCPLDGAVWEFHAVADPAHHSRWITPRVLTCLFVVAKEVGATHVVGQNTSPEIKRIWERLGAVVFDKLSILKLED